MSSAVVMPTSGSARRRAKKAARGGQWLWDLDVRHAIRNDRLPLYFVQATICPCGYRSWVMPSADPELFFPGPGRVDHIREARKVCRLCPVQVRCLDWSLELDATEHLFGIWGGVTEYERKRLRLKRRAS